jgi:hypothetical protein
MPERELGACARKSSFSVSDARSSALRDSGWRRRSMDGSRFSTFSSACPKSVRAAVFGLVAANVSADHLIDPRFQGSDLNDDV